MSLLPYMGRNTCNNTKTSAIWHLCCLVQSRRTLLSSPRCIAKTQLKAVR